MSIAWEKKFSALELNEFFFSPLYIVLIYGWCAYLESAMRCSYNLVIACT